MSTTTNLGFPIVDNIGADSSTVVSSYLQLITGSGSTSISNIAQTLIDERVIRYAKTGSEWESSDIVMRAGEIGYNKTNEKIKVGNGTSTWDSLAYFETGAPSTGATQTFYISSSSAFGLTKPQGDVTVQYALATLSSAVTKEFAYAPASNITISPTSLYGMYVMMSGLAVSSSNYTITTSLKKGDTIISHGEITLTPYNTTQIVHIPMNTNYISSELTVSTSESLSILIGITRNSGSSHNVNLLSSSSSPSFFVKNGGIVGSNVVLDKFGDNVYPQSYINAILNNTKLSSSGDGSNVTSTFTGAPVRANINTGETTSVLFGKIKKFFNDLGSLAFKSNISTTDINDLSVTTSKIENGAVTVDKIGTDAISTAKIANSAVTTAKIAQSAVASGNIMDGAVTTAKIAQSAVEDENIASGAVTTAKILDANVTAEKIANNAVTSDKISNGAVSNAKMGSMVAGTLKGRNGTADGAPIDLPVLDVMTMLGAAAATHTHGNIASDGKIGNVADKFLYTGTNGTIGTKTITETQALIGSGSLTNTITYYVATNGNDANDGLTSGTAFRTIARAIDLLPHTTNGDYVANIYVGPGGFSTTSICNFGYEVHLYPTHDETYPITGSNSTILYGLRISNASVTVHNGITLSYSASASTNSDNSLLSIETLGKLTINNCECHCYTGVSGFSSLFKGIHVSNGGFLTYSGNGRIKLLGTSNTVMPYGISVNTGGSLSIYSFDSTYAKISLHVEGGNVYVRDTFYVSTSDYGILNRGGIIELCGIYSDSSIGVNSFKVVGGTIQIGAACNNTGTISTIYGGRVYKSAEATIPAITKASVTLPSSGWTQTTTYYTNTVTVSGVKSDSILIIQAPSDNNIASYKNYALGIISVTPLPNGTASSIVFSGVLTNNTAAFGDVKLNLIIINVT